MNTEGVRHIDWHVPLGADGYGVAFDPFDEDLFYQMWQNGNLMRFHGPSYENVSIEPQPAAGEPAERWNWDAPLEVSQTQEGRLYYGSQRVWRSNDRGNSWMPVSGDLTTNANRFELPMADRVRSVDSLLDLRAMSRYATLTAIAESPLDDNRLWTGSDDGLVHTTPDGGASWRKLSIGGLPERAFVNDVAASQHDPNAAFVVADNHKTGDFQAYLFATDDGGDSWRDISGNLPDGVIVWAIQQDAEEPGLLFLGAENGLYVTLDGGKRWDELAGAPTIPFRDVTLQRRELDVVGATFGRGVYLLDDYTPLREMAARLRDTDALADESELFGLRDAWWYLPGVPGQARGLPTDGSSHWRGDNPPYGAVFTVRLANVPENPKEVRRERERAIDERDGDVPFPGWDVLQKERRAKDVRYYLEIVDAIGTPIRRLAVPATQGTHRIAWDMRGAPADAISINVPGFRPPWYNDPQGALYPPGRYQARLVQVGPESVTVVGPAQEFGLRGVGTLPVSTDAQNATAFHTEVVAALSRVEAVSGTLNLLDERLKYLRKATDEAPAVTAALHLRLDAVESEIDQVRAELSGNQSQLALSEWTAPGVINRIQAASTALTTRLGPTQTERDSLAMGLAGLAAIETR
ncbi:MAG: glycosyl hydrolase, partial [Pseudomonadota bacterium]